MINEKKITSADLQRNKLKHNRNHASIVVYTVHVHILYGHYTVSDWHDLPLR